MSTNVTKFSPTEMAKILQERLINGTLNISELEDSSGWSYQSIRSKANTVAKRLGGKVAPVKRGVWILVTTDQPENKLVNTTES